MRLIRLKRFFTTFRAFGMRLKNYLLTLLVGLFLLVVLNEFLIYYIVIFQVFHLDLTLSSALCLKFINISVRLAS